MIVELYVSSKFRGPTAHKVDAYFGTLSKVQKYNVLGPCTRFSFPNPFVSRPLNFMIGTKINSRNKDGRKKKTLNLNRLSIPVNQHPDAGPDERPDNVDGGDLQVEQLVLKNTVPKKPKQRLTSPVHLSDSKSKKKTV
jgi:hypothetical protein